MTVAELIEELESYKTSAPVFLVDDRGEWSKVYPQFTVDLTGTLMDRETDYADGEMVLTITFGD